MKAKKIISIVFLSYNWTVKTKGQREQLIPYYSKLFKHGNSVVGGTMWKTIYYMCPTFGGLIYNYSLIGFEGIINDDQSGATINMSARFGQPFIWIYILAGLSFPLTQLFDNSRANLQPLLPESWVNFILPPILVWLSLIGFYLFKLQDGKKFIEDTLKQFEV